MFQEIAVQEAKIRKDPIARTSDLLKKVFGSKLAKAKSIYFPDKKNPTVCIAGFNVSWNS